MGARSSTEEAQSRNERTCSVGAKVGDWRPRRSICAETLLSVGAGGVPIGAASIWSRHGRRCELREGKALTAFREKCKIIRCRRGFLGGVGVAE